MHIFFDIDGVLLKDFRKVPETRYWAKELGIDSEDLSKHFFQGIWQEVIVGKKDLKEALQECFPLIGFKGKPEQVIDRWFKCDSVINHELVKYLPIISAKRNVKLYIATNQEHYRAKYLWENLGFKNLFEKMYYSAQLGVVKEDPSYFKQINKELKLTDETVVFFDDALENVEISCTQGWKSYHYQTLSDFEENEYIKSLIL